MKRLIVPILFLITTHQPVPKVSLFSFAMAIDLDSSLIQNIFRAWSKIMIRQNQFQERYSFLGQGSYQRGDNIIKGISQYKYIPPENHRRINIFDFSHLRGDHRDETVRNLTDIIQNKKPIYEDKEKIRVLELALLKKNLWATCEWAERLPYPLNMDTQCTQAELLSILDKSYENKNRSEDTNGNQTEFVQS